VAGQFLATVPGQGAGEPAGRGGQPGGDAATEYAGDSEAAVREIEQSGESMPEGSYGRHNRQVVAARKRRIAAGLHAVERAYRLAIERDAVVTAESAMTLNSPEQAADLERELE
jgi:hypothetical protein